MANISDEDICRRIEQLRTELYGARGKASFARKLGISASTYQSYESDRIPPAEVLVRIADLAEVSLRWLLTGKSTSGPDVPAGHPVLQRAAKLLDKHPDIAAPLGAFLDILAGTMAFPAKQAPDRAQVDGSADGGAAAPVDGVPVAADGSDAPDSAERDSWIPILGRSAAGLAQFWADGEDTSMLTELDGLIARHSATVRRSVRPARVDGRQGQAPESVQVVTLTSPRSEEAAQFVVCQSIRARHHDAFAVRIDGESMSPDIRHGDLVILSPLVSAIDGAAAVVQLKGQIGVTCKLFRRQGRMIHLVPVNEQFQPQAYEAEMLVWALRVIARVRPA